VSRLPAVLWRQRNLDRLRGEERQRLVAGLERVLTRRGGAPVG